MEDPTLGAGCPHIWRFSRSGDGNRRDLADRSEGMLSELVRSQSADENALHVRQQKIDENGYVYRRAQQVEGRRDLHQPQRR